jgi:hypothetical protein
MSAIHTQQPARRRHDRSIRTVRQAFDYVTAQLPRGARVNVYYSENCETGQPFIRDWTVEVATRRACASASARTADIAVRRALSLYRSRAASQSATPLRLAV